MKIETETHTGAEAPKVQMRSRRRENMNKEVRTGGVCPPTDKVGLI